MWCVSGSLRSHIQGNDETNHLEIGEISSSIDSNKNEFYYHFMFITKGKIFFFIHLIMCQ